MALRFKLFIVCFIYISVSVSQRINIGIYSESNVKTFVFTPVKGNYEFTGDNSVKNIILQNDVIYIALLGDSVNIKSLDKNFGNFGDVYFIGENNSCSFKIKPVFPDINTREYENDLRVTILYKKLLLVNHVELENYIAGVVESEGGSKAHNEYYKSQAIICRTYALSNFDRHVSEGFNLCDGVHCQAYKSKCHKNPEIYSSTISTKGLIIVDTTLNLITAAFHSNCGGMTANCEDVWLKHLSYLRSVRDPYCTGSFNATWQKTITADQWKVYLKKSNFTVTEPAKASDFNFYQEIRKANYEYNGQTIPLKRIRTDWGLKSTYFTLTAEGNNLIMKGRGYGHGTGLCQEGAMKMAESGITYDKIIKFYYTNTYTISLRALEFFKEPVQINTFPTDSTKININ